MRTWSNWFGLKCRLHLCGGRMPLDGPLCWQCDTYHKQEF